MHQLSSINSMIACPDCDLLLAFTTVEIGHGAHCPRCSKQLYRPKPGSVDKVLALAITGLLLYIPAMTLPLITLSSFGIQDNGNVLETIILFFTKGYFFVGIMLLLSATLLPFMLLSLIGIVSFHIKYKQFPPYLPNFFRYYLHLREWGMLEVYLLGIVITLIKMSADAEISYDPGFFFFLALVLVSLGISTVIDYRLFWESIEQLSGNTSNYQVERKGQTALTSGLIACTCCQKLSPDSSSHCSRCHEKIYKRTPQSISKTWALLITSVIVFFPANFLPIMQVDFMGVPEQSTILDGIIYFFVDGAYGIGIIIFTASILVPIFKVAGLLIILLSIHFKKSRFLQQKAVMFRFIEFIGRWSMLDIFVIALLTVVVNFGFFTSIHAAPAATYFCMVVVATMLAAITFDPRLMWDTLAHNQGNENE